MPCMFSAPLTEEQIIAALEDDVPPDIAAHLRDCPECRARFEAEQAFQGGLMQRLFRIECPSAGKLRDYAFGMVSADLQQTIDRHLKTCRYCRDDLDSMQRFAEQVMDEWDAEPLKSTPLVKWPLVPPAALFGQSGRLPRGAGLRGRGLFNGVMLEATGVSISLEAAQDDESVITISGQFIVTADDLVKWADALVEIWQDGRVARFVSVDESGWFECHVDSIQNMRVVITNRDEQVLVFDDIQFPKQYGH